jgi:hypothetical protein
LSCSWTTDPGRWTRPRSWNLYRRSYARSKAAFYLNKRKCWGFI